MKEGDRVKLMTLISTDPKDWYMSSREFELVQQHVGKIGTIVYVQKHFNDDTKISYFLDVRYSSGYKLRRVNKLAFELVEFNFDYI